VIIAARACPVPLRPTAQALKGRSPAPMTGPAAAQQLTVVYGLGGDVNPAWPSVTEVLGPPPGGFGPCWLVSSWEASWFGAHGHAGDRMTE
jgi:hypothetical protein